MAGPAGSFKAVIAALAANSFITVIKFVAFAFSGSGAMLSEAIHSAADAANQFLLFMGLKRGSRASDESFHYGYGGERFVFGLLSAAGIFFIGCGVTVYHGIHGLMDPHMPEFGLLTWVVLGTSLVVEGASTLFAFKTVLAHRPPDYPFFRYLKEKVDPAALAILLEDSAAILGLILAAGGIVLAATTGNPMWDSIGSIVVGLILGYVAFHLVIENRELLLGKAVPPGTREKFEKILATRRSLHHFHDVKTRMLTPEAYHLKAELSFDYGWLAREIEPGGPQARGGRGRAGGRPPRLTTPRRRARPAPGGPPAPPPPRPPRPGGGAAARRSSPR